MSIIVTPEFWMGATARAIADGLRLQGEVVEEIDIGRYLVASDGFLLKVASRLLKRASLAAYNRALRESAQAAEAEMLVSIKGLGLELATVRQVATRGVKTVIYYPDVHFAYPMVDWRVIEEADLVCTTKRLHLDYLAPVRGPGRTVLVHHGYSPAAHHPWNASMQEDQYVYDICYAGHPSRFKLEWLSAVAAAFPTRKMIVVGNSWSEIARGTSLEPFVCEQPFVGQALAWLHQHSRVNIAVHSGPLGPDGWQDDVSTRTFEIPACGGFMLHPDNAEVRSLYDVPQEIDTFASPAELCSKIEHYLARPEDRAAMIARAYERAVPAYSYHARAAEILAAARSVPATKVRRSS